MKLKNIIKKGTLIWPFLIIFYFLTRTINFKIIPIFTDEAIYTYWAQIALNDPVNRFISLEDGKQPLFIWLAAIFQHFIKDPLIATRLVSVFSGFGSLIGIYLLTKELFEKRAALVASFLYIIIPFTLLYDRMALFDSLLTMLGIYAVLFTVKMARDPKLESALLTGTAIGLAKITKSSGNFFQYLLPFSILLFNFRRKNNVQVLVKWFGFVSIAVVLASVIYNSLRVSGYFYIIERKNYEFIRTSQDVINDPFIHFFSNSQALIGWISTYLGIPLFIIYIASIAYFLKKKNLEFIYLQLFILVPFLAEATFNKVLYPRFALFYFPYIIISIAAFSNLILEKFKKHQIKTLGLLFLILLIPLSISYKLLTNPPYAKIPESDSGQYFNDWPSGYGINEIVEIFRSELNRQEVHVATEGTFGLLPFALNVYFYADENIHIYPYWPVNANNLPTQILETAKSKKTYFIFYQNQEKITNPQLKLISSYQKGIGNSYMRLFEVLP